jgi:tRNA dimethylallyltransferase
MKPVTPVLIISGPTASGKSALAMRLATALDGEIVSADSVQVYRGLDIGSAKPTAAERAAIPHHAIDLLEPTEQGDAMLWARVAADAIAAILARGRTAIVCGGTGLYLRALFTGFADIPDVPDTVTEAIADALNTNGPESLHHELSRVDPRAAALIAPRDRQRIGRALAVFRATGVPLSEWQARGTSAPGAAWLATSTFIALDPPRDRHRSTLQTRAEDMLRAGFVDEVRALLARGIPPTAPGLQSLGYRTVTDALTSNDPARLDVTPLAAAIGQAHARYAKRQRTWFLGSAGADYPWRVFDPFALPQDLSLVLHTLTAETP